MQRHITLILVGWLLFGLAQAESDPATILEEQTQRRRQEEIDRLAREQRFDHSQFERKLNRFDQKASRLRGTTDRMDERRLHQRLNDIRQQDARTRAHRKQAFRQLELGDRRDDFRQLRELERLRHRQRGDAFVNRQKLRLRRSQLNAHGRR